MLDMYRLPDLNTARSSLSLSTCVVTKELGYLRRALRGALRFGVLARLVNLRGTHVNPTP
jgi:hypothetical protein